MAMVSMLLACGLALVAGRPGEGPPLLLENDRVRLEFDAPTGMVPSRSGVTGATSDTTVQFVTTGVTDANLGLVYPQDFAPVNPTISFARQVATVKIDGTANSTAVGTLFSQPYTTSGLTTTTVVTPADTATSAVPEPVQTA